MRILAVGTATLDLVCTLPFYPQEDQEIRAKSLRSTRGGNATNSLVVLRGLGHQCSWAGVLAEDTDSRHIIRDLNEQGVDLSWLYRHAGGKTPTSYIWVNEGSGSRTIVHYRDLPEYPFAAFQSIDLGLFDWIHFEGRNIPELKSMLLYLRQQQGPPCSLEIEKPREGIEELLYLPDLLLIGKDYAQATGYLSAASLLNDWHQRGLRQPKFCAWGEQGGWAMDSSGKLYHQAASVTEELVDTLGAGDVFNAGVIHHWLLQQSLEEVLQQAVALAGRKCTQHGFAGLASAAASSSQAKACAVTRR